MKMSAKLYSLPAFAKLRTMGPRKDAVRCARHIATEMAADGALEPGPVPHVATIETDPEVIQNLQNLMTEELGDSSFSKNGFVGEKYDSNADLADTAKLVRTEIKIRVAKGELPKAKYAVRIQRYSMGQSMSIKVGDLPKDFPVLNVERVEFTTKRPHDHCELPHYAQETIDLIKKLECLGNAFRHDHSDSQTDYSHTNFYLNVDVDGDFERSVRAAVMAQVAV